MVIEIYLQIILTVTFLSFFFFLYVTTVEKKTVENQVAEVTKNICQDINYI